MGIWFDHGDVLEAYHVVRDEELFHLTTNLGRGLASYPIDSEAPVLQSNSDERFRLRLLVISGTPKTAIVGHSRLSRRA